jgi:hypothetical protein
LRKPDRNDAAKGNSDLLQAQEPSHTPHHGGNAAAWAVVPSRVINHTENHTECVDLW